MYRRLCCPVLTRRFSDGHAGSHGHGKTDRATDIDGMREQCKDGESGLLIPPGDPKSLAVAIIRLLDDVSLATGIGAKARERIVREFPIEKTVAETLEVYRSLLSMPMPMEVPK